MINKAKLLVTGYLAFLIFMLPAGAQTKICDVVDSRMQNGQNLLSGSCLRSANGRFALVMQTNGDLALHDLTTFNTLWDTGTAGQSVSFATIDSTGNLDLFGPSHNLVFSNHAGQGEGSYFLTVQNDGNLVTYKATWSTNTSVQVNSPPMAPKCSLIGSLNTNQHLNAGSCLLSFNTLFQVTMQSDGKLVLYNRVTGRTLWSSPDVGKPASYATVKSDGELVIVDSNGDVLWSNDSIQPTGYYSLNMGDDGNLSVYGSTWSTGTSVPSPLSIGGGNLDQQNGWRKCISRGCSPRPPAVIKFTQNNVAPSLDGAAISTYQAGNSKGYWGILYYFTHHLSSQEQRATNYSAEWSYKVDNTQNVQALEFDFPVILNNLKFYFGTQCVRNGYWQYWNPNNGTWHNTTLRCTQITSGWHRLRWLGTRAGHQFNYSKLEIDGALYDVDIDMNAPPRTHLDPSNGTITIQFQPDGKPNTGFHEYIDRVNSWAW